MALLTPTWLQAGTYAAKEDRTLIDATWTEGVIAAASGALAASQRAAGANNSVDVAAGVCVIQGDDATGQGKYLVRNDATTNVAFDAAPVSNKRIDVLYVRVNDTSEGGPAGNNATFGVEKGTVAASPTAPATPTSAVALAQVMRTAGDVSITTAMITDVRSEASFAPASFANPRIVGVREPFTVSATAATGAINMNCATTSAMFYTSNASGNWTLNLRASSTAALTTLVGIGEVITVTFAAQQGVTGYYMTQLNIDGAAQSVKWQDGVTPSLGAPTVIDVMTFTCIRTGASTWTVLGTRAFFS